MKNRIGCVLLAVAALSASAWGQGGLPLPAPVEKALAARASNVTEVTLNKSMLDFAAKFMNGKNQNDAAIKQLITGLDGIYVREYEFDKEGQYSPDDVDKLRQAFETQEWTPIVRTRERKGTETTDVMMKQVNGETRGMFVLAAEPKELTIVLILGPIRMDQLGMLKGVGGLGSLGEVEKKAHAAKAQLKSGKKGGDQ